MIINILNPTVDFQENCNDLLNRIGLTVEQRERSVRGTVWKITVLEDITPLHLELIAKVSEGIVTSEDLKYIGDRQKEYPTVAAQLDMLYRAMESGEIPKAVEFFDALKAVKDSNPKPTVEK